MLIAVVGVPVVFPDGRLPGPRWRWLAWSAAAAVICLFLGNVLSPHTQQARLAHWQSPLGLPGRYGGVANTLSAAGVLFAAAAAAGAIAGLVTRWRRGGPRVRQQLLLLALAACPPAVVFVTVLITNGVPGWIFGVVLVPLPIAIAVAILGHGLYDLRRAAQRTLLWLVMSGVVIGIYAAVVIAAAALVPGHHGWWLSAAAAAVAALLLIPLREKLQRGVTRVVYGRWHEPYEVLAGLGERLEPPPTSTGCWMPPSPSSPPGWTCAILASAISTGPSSQAPGVQPRMSALIPARPPGRKSPASRCWPMALRSAL